MTTKVSKPKSCTPFVRLVWSGGNAQFRKFIEDLFRNNPVDYSGWESGCKNCRLFFFFSYESKLVSEQVMNRHKEESPSPSANVSR